MEVLPRLGAVMSMYRKQNFSQPCNSTMQSNLCSNSYQKWAQELKDQRLSEEIEAKRQSENFIDMYVLFSQYCPELLYLFL
jgi:hypothetical protein